MLALLVALVIFYLGFTEGVAWYWWIVGVLAFAASATPEGYLGPSIWRWLKRRRTTSTTRDDDPRTLSGSQFEHWVADHMQREGYEAKVVGGPSDGGCDVLAQRGPETVAVQCKRTSSSVGVEAVQDAISARAVHDADEAWLVTTGEPTGQARELAERVGIKIQEV